MTLLEQLRTQSPEDRAHTLRVLIADLRSDLERAASQSPRRILHADLVSVERQLAAVERSLREGAR
jgi:hypothetical protein